MNENIKAIKEMVKEIEDDITEEQYNAYQRIIEALEDLERMEAEK